MPQFFLKKFCISGFPKKALWHIMFQYPAILKLFSSIIEEPKLFSLVHRGPLQLLLLRQIQENALHCAEC